MYSPEEVATYFRVNVVTVYRWIRSGKLRAVKIGKSYRIEAADVQSFKTSHQ